MFEPLHTLSRPEMAGLGDESTLTKYLAESEQPATFFSIAVFNQ